MTDRSIEQVINDAVDEILERISCASGEIGEPKIVSERLEPPQDIGEIPSIFVVPVTEGGDSVSFHMTSSDTNHSFQIEIIGYYIFKDIWKYRTLRQYGYTCLRLVKGDGQKIAGLNINGRAKIRFGYFTLVDKLIYSFRITLDVITLGV